MQPLRRGDTGPAVVEIRTMLSQFGLLGDATDGSADHFDPVVEHAVRAFQQQRGLITDGMSVASATDRALREAGWTLGDRMLALLISTPMCVFGNRSGIAFFLALVFPIQHMSYVYVDIIAVSRAGILTVSRQFRGKL